jgi:hypothetical protein
MLFFRAKDSLQVGNISKKMERRLRGPMLQFLHSRDELQVLTWIAHGLNRDILQIHKASTKMRKRLDRGDGGSPGQQGNRQEAAQLCSSKAALGKRGTKRLELGRCRHNDGLSC